ncbi:MAG: hypothetical protein EON60_13455 [Alphaproteobacteria bacterium]|nr:MAG: hypothetical protein EON60_13455 [Alphaproteobacteria bacterium]
MTVTTVKRRKVGIWVHSGGVDPQTGEPSYASKLRIFALLAEMKALKGTGTDVVVFFSGEPTRKSGGYQQGEVLAKWENLGDPPPTFHVFNASMIEAFRDIAHHHRHLDELRFVNDDAHMSRYRWQFAKADPFLAAKVVPVEVPVLQDGEYLERYSLDYMAAYNAAAWLRETVKAVGMFQFLLFLVDRAVNKPTENPLKQAVAKAAAAMLRKDLR